MEGVGDVWEVETLGGGTAEVFWFVSVDVWLDVPVDKVALFVDVLVDEVSRFVEVTGPLVDSAALERSASKEGP